MSNKLKVLNLYAGIGGNRKLWEDVEVTAIEMNKDIAQIYQDFFPDDEVLIEDAHEYLLKHYQEFDFIWSSPPCPTHSRFRYIQPKDTQPYPDMKLWQEIIFLKQWCPSLYCIENVITYYEPLVKPIECNSHYFWTNFYVIKQENETRNIRRQNVEKRAEGMGYNFGKIKAKKSLAEQVLLNCVEPELGKHILECARAKMEGRKINAEQPDLFL